ncbi:MAG: RNA polymerase sigma factor [Ktedonobacteraceae bacterium]|nr:RNA polymerase sigma factor [Ktedonobacteraceae bacterium]
MTASSLLTAPWSEILPRIVRYCHTFVGDEDFAQDLAQDTCAHAWASSSPPPVQEMLPWLLGIARHVCQQWFRDHSRQSLHIISLPSSFLSAEPSSTDPSWYLEHQELLEVVSHLLDDLPASLRSLLMARYVDDQPIEALARTFALSPAAVSMRLVRGKRALRNAIQRRSPVHAQALGLEPTPSRLLTHVWCPFCGDHHLVRVPTAKGAAFCCPACSSHPLMHITYCEYPHLYVGISSHKALLTRQLEAIRQVAEFALREGNAPCFGCSHEVSVRRRSLHERDWICPSCGSAKEVPTFTRAAYVLTLPQTQAFWRAHPRMRYLGHEPGIVDGQECIVTRFSAHGGGDQLEVVTDLATWMPFEVKS